MQTFTTPRRTVASSKSTSDDGIFNPLTGPMNSTSIREVRFSIYMMGIFNCAVRPGVQWSSDGVTWGTPVAVNWDNPSAANWKTSANWTYGDQWVDTAGMAGETLFVRFGVFARSTSGSVVRNAQVHLRYDLHVVAASNTLTVGPLVLASGTTTTPRFYAMTEPLLARDIRKIRGTWLMDGNTGGAQIRGAFQTSQDGVTWDAPDPIRVPYRTTDGYDIGTAFQTLDLNGKTYIRFGIQITTSAGARDMCRASLRVDTRAD